MKNGWAKWLVGVLFTVLFTAFTTLCSYVIANDEKARDRDTKLQEELNACVKEQMTTNQKILVAQAKQEAILEQILREIRK